MQESSFLSIFLHGWHKEPEGGPRRGFYKFTLKVFCEWVCVCVCEVWVLCVEVVGLCLGECVCVGVVGACVWVWLSVW